MTVIILYTLWSKQIQLQLSLNYKDRFESASSLAPAQLYGILTRIDRIDYIMTNKRNPVAKKLFRYRISYRAQEGVLKCTYTRDAGKGVIICVGL